MYCGSPENKLNPTCESVMLRDYHPVPVAIFYSKSRIGFVGADLYRCGNAGCAFSAPQVSDFRDHLLTCELSVDQMYLACFHCDKQFKHVPTLMEHLKTHGVRRYVPLKLNYKGNIRNFCKQQVSDCGAIVVVIK